MTTTPIILNNSPDKITTIFHCADIHIKKTSDRKDEYEHVFNNLQTTLKTEKNAILIIAGDLIDFKQNISTKICFLFIRKTKQYSSNV